MKHLLTLILISIGLNCYSQKVGYEEILKEFDLPYFTFKEKLSAEDKGDGLEYNEESNSVMKELRNNKLYEMYSKNFNDADELQSVTFYIWPYIKINDARAIIQPMLRSKFGTESSIVNRLTGDTTFVYKTDIYTIDYMPNLKESPGWITIEGPVAIKVIKGLNGFLETNGETLVSSDSGMNYLIRLMADPKFRELNLFIQSEENRGMKSISVIFESNKIFTYKLILPNKPAASEMAMTYIPNDIWNKILIAKDVKLKINGLKTGTVSFNKDHLKSIALLLKAIKK